MIKYNEVTWYSKLAAIIVCVFIIPAIFFSLGERYQATSTQDQIADQGDVSTTPTSGSTGTGFKPGGTQKTPYAATVTLTSSGFSPKIVHVKVGQVVHFVNGTNLGMRVIAQTVQGGSSYPGFDEGKTVGRGGTYDFLFNNVGSWNYRNLADDVQVVGNVVVTAQ